MRLSQPPTLLSLLAIVLSSTHTTHAKPFARSDSLNEVDNSSLVERQGGYACGYGSLTCGTADACYTDANGQAQCATSGSSGGTQQNNANNGQWQLYTTTFTTNELTTITSTYSLLATPTTQVAAGGACDTSIGETPCGQNPSNGGTLCCASGQQCLYQGQCGSSGAGAGDVSSAYLFSVTSTPTGTAFIRPTTATTQTVTSTGSATTTVPYQSTSPTASTGTTTAGMQSTTTNNGLSGGAIAGIVIGVLLGIFLLLLLCGFLCFKGILDSFLALLGLGPRRRRRESTYIEERQSHHASGGGGGGRTWFGQRPSRPQREKKSSGAGGFGAVAGGLTALAVILGLKRRMDKRDKSSYGTGSTYTYSDYTSASEYSCTLRMLEASLTAA